MEIVHDDVKGLAASFVLEILFRCQKNFNSEIFLDIKAYHELFNSRPGPAKKIELGKWFVGRKHFQILAYRKLPTV